jgi:hypothetical protein
MRERAKERNEREGRKGDVLGSLVVVGVCVVWLVRRIGRLLGVCRCRTSRCVVWWGVGVWVLRMGDNTRIHRYTHTHTDTHPTHPNTHLNTHTHVTHRLRMGKARKTPTRRRAFISR